MSEKKLLKNILKSYKKYWLIRTNIVQLTRNLSRTLQGGIEVG